MAHHFTIHSIDKDLIQGVMVISCLDNDHFEDKMTPVLKIVRCGFNCVFRSYFDVTQQWDSNYFVVKASSVLFLLNYLNSPFGKGDIDVDDLGDYNKVITCLEELSKNPDPEATYLLSWEK